MELFLTTDTQVSPFIQDRVKNAFLKAKTGDRPPLNQIITTLHTVATDSGFHTQFSSFIAKLAATDCTWKFWVQFVFKDALAYIGLYIAIRSGDWDLQMVSIKMMAPIFSATLAELLTISHCAPNAYRILRNQIFPEENDKTDTTPTSFLTANANDKKTATNVRAQITAIKSAGLLKIVESNRGLINPFSKKKATHEQEHDLSSFRDIGTTEFEKYISYHVLQQASIPFRRRKRRLATFSQKKPSKRQIPAGCNRPPNILKG